MRVWLAVLVASAAPWAAAAARINSAGADGLATLSAGSVDKRAPTHSKAPTPKATKATKQPSIPKNRKRLPPSLLVTPGPSLKPVTLPQPAEIAEFTPTELQPIVETLVTLGPTYKPAQRPSAEELAEVELVVTTTRPNPGWAPRPTTPEISEVIAFEDLPLPRAAEDELALNVAG
jgi:hypothetical protein